MGEASRVRIRNAAATREAILQAARGRFSRDAYEQVGCREVAADAGVDPALVYRYFGSKEELFAQVLGHAGRDPIELISGDLATFGERAARMIFDPEVCSNTQGLEFIVIAARSAASPIAQTIVRHDIERRFVEPFAAWAGGSDAAVRARLAVSVLMGVCITRGLRDANAPDVSEGKEEVSRLAALLQSLAEPGRGAQRPESETPA